MGYPEAQYVIDELSMKIQRDFDVVDDMLSAKIVCQSYDVGAVFEIIRDDENHDNITVTITEKTKRLSDGRYIIIVPVPLGEYTVNITCAGYNFVSKINVNTVGTHYYTEYESEMTLIQTVTTTSTVSIPSELSYVFVTAIGGGGGGGGGGKASSDSCAGPGGSGGNAGTITRFQKVAVKDNKLAITIGAGGAGGAAGGGTGKTGNATIVGDSITLPGGAGGAGGAVAASGTGWNGKSGSAGGANIDGATAAAGTGGTNSSQNGWAAPKNGTLGGGGGGGGSKWKSTGDAGGAGGAGVVRIYKGVRVPNE
jgi:hypothetical protein